MSFTDDFKKWITKVKDRSDFVMQDTSREMSNRIISRTGVSTGATKGSWTPAINTPKTEEYAGGFPAWTKGENGWEKDMDVARENSAEAEMYVLPKVDNVTRQLEIENTFYLSNPIKYSPQVEYEGWPYAEPYLMMNRTKEEFAAIVAESIIKAKGKIK